MSNVPITPGTGAVSVAGEAIAGLTYQQVKIVDGTAASSTPLKVNSDGSIGTSIIGTVPVGASVIGLVPIQTSNTSVISYIQNSVATVIVGGSIAASFTPPANQSVSGTVHIDNFASVISYQLAGSILATSATVNPTANQSVSGTVGASVIGTVPTTQAGTWITSIVSTVPSSVVVGASIFGQLPSGTAVLGSVATLQGTNPWNIAGSVAAFVTGSSSIITVEKSSSILAVPVGSVISVIQSNSVAGTYAEDAAHTSGDRGLFVMQVRNDTMASITSNDGDYSPIGGGPVGETITANAPITKWIRGTADLRGSSGGSVTAIAAQGASVFTYITGIQIANMGSASVLVTLGGGLGSILGYSIAPAGGGSNIYYPNALKTGENSAFTASISGVASVLVSAQGFIAKI